MVPSDGADDRFPQRLRLQDLATIARLVLYECGRDHLILVKHGFRRRPETGLMIMSLS
jgi:hypothetical protein